MIFKVLDVCPVTNQTNFIVSLMADAYYNHYADIISFNATIF